MNGKFPLWAFEEPSDFAAPTSVPPLTIVKADENAQGNRRRPYPSVPPVERGTSARRASS